MSASGRLPAVWITGIGLVAPLGTDREAAWTALCDGHAAPVGLVSGWTERGYPFLQTSASDPLPPRGRGGRRPEDQDNAAPGPDSRARGSHPLPTSPSEGEVGRAAAGWRVERRPRMGNTPHPSPFPQGGRGSESVIGRVIEYGFPAPYPHRFTPTFDPLPHLVADALTGALADAQLTPNRPAFDPDRAAVLFGLSKGRMLQQERVYEHLLRDPHAAHAILARDWPALDAGDGARQIARYVQARGPCLAPVAACATGLIAAIQGADLIRHGYADLTFVGAADASLTPFLLGAFRRLRVLAPVGEDNDPACAIRPWDKTRRGFLVGEGAAVLVLERDDHARARGVRPYAEFAGGAMGSDAHHLTDQNPDPSGLAHLITLALRNANLSPADVDHINVHGTATKSNDPLECRAIRQAFGSHADSLSCSANKAQIGHLLGAAGAVELAFTALAIRDQFAPPTLNLTDPDPFCDLDGTPLVGRSRPIRAAIKLSLGFGGHLACAVLRRPDAPRREGESFS